MATPRPLARLMVRLAGLTMFFLGLVAPTPLSAADWSTYRSADYRFRFEYPSEWKVWEELRDQPGLGTITYVFMTYRTAGGDEAVVQLWVSWIRVSPDEIGALSEARYTLEIDASTRLDARIVDQRLLLGDGHAGFYYTYRVPAAESDRFAIMNARARFETRYVHVDGAGHCGGAPPWVFTDCRAILRRVFESFAFSG